MSDSIKKVLLVLVLLFAGWFVISKVVAIAMMLVFKVVLPVLVVGGIGYLAYRALTGGKSLPGGRRSLP